MTSCPLCDYEAESPDMLVVHIEGAHPWPRNAPQPMPATPVTSEDVEGVQ